MPPRQTRTRLRLSNHPVLRQFFNLTMHHIPFSTTTTTSITFLPSVFTSVIRSIFLILVFFTAAAFSYVRSDFPSSINSFRTTANTTANPSPKAQFLPSWFNPHSIIGGSPNARSAPMPSNRRFSDQSSYVGLTSSSAPTVSGAVVAVADFNRDRFLDLLMLDSSNLRALGVMLWDHDAYAFKHAPNPIKLDSLTSVKLGKVTAVYVADFGDDGALDVLVADGTQGVIFFGDGEGGFNVSNSIVIPELPPVAAVVDADADSVPDMFVIFKNMTTRGFYQLQKPKSVNTTSATVSSLSELQKEATLVFKQWPKGVNLGSNRKPCRTEDDMVAAIAFADMDGDCLPDLVIPTTCGLEVWSNPVSSDIDDIAFWDLSSSPTSGQMKLLDTQVFNYEHGDRVISVADFDSDGTNDIAVVNRNRHDMLVHRNIQKVRAVGKLCERDDQWTLQKVVGMADGVNLRKSRIGALLGGVDVLPRLHVGDYDQDGLADVIAIDGSSTQPVIFHNRGGWGDGKRRPQEAHFELVTSNDDVGKGNSNALSAAFFDTDESGRQDVLIVRGGNDTRLMWNNVNERWDALFFKGTMLSGLPYRMEPKPFAPVVGNTIKLSYVERGSLLRRRRVRRVCSQCAQSGGLLQLSSCNCQYGLHGIANYIEELCAGAGGSKREWTELMPNSMAVIWGDSSGNTAAWWMEYFTQRRGSQMLRVTAILMVSLVMLGAAILYLQNKEAKLDREIDERESARLFSFVV